MSFLKYSKLQLSGAKTAFTPTAAKDAMVQHTIIVTSQCQLPVIYYYYFKIYGVVAGSMPTSKTWEQTMSGAAERESGKASSLSFPLEFTPNGT